MRKKSLVLSVITTGAVALAVVAGTVSSGPPSGASHAKLTARAESFSAVNLDACPILYLGYPTGGCVAQLQTDLKTVQDVNLTVDGAFGRQTYEAVTAFQQAQGIQPDGKVGPATKQALAAVLANYSVPTPELQPLPAEDRSFVGCPELKEGVTSRCVTRLRSELVSFDSTYQLPFDDTYGPAMTAAVRDFQTRNQLSPTGEVDSATADLLDFQAGPKTVCLAQGGYFEDDGTCGSDGAVPMGKSVWECVQDEAGKDIAEYIEQADKSAEKAGEEIPKGALREFLKKANAPAEAFKCITWG